MWWFKNESSYCLELSKILPKAVYSCLKHFPLLANPSCSYRHRVRSTFRGSQSVCRSPSLGKKPSWARDYPRGLIGSRRLKEEVVCVMKKYTCPLRQHNKCIGNLVMNLIERYLSMNRLSSNPCPNAANLWPIIIPTHNPETIFERGLWDHSSLSFWCLPDIREIQPVYPTHDPAKRTDPRLGRSLRALRLFFYVLVWVNENLLSMQISLLLHDNVSFLDSKLGSITQMPLCK